MALIVKITINRNQAEKMSSRSPALYWQKELHPNPKYYLTVILSLTLTLTLNLVIILYPILILT